MAHIYCISGFGADEKVFKYLDFGSNVVHFLQWTTPKKSETIEEYASQMASLITEPDPVIAGLSFGGMMAIEIAKQMNTQKIFLISSIKSKSEKPFYMKLGASLHLNEWLPLRPYPFLDRIENYNLGIQTDEERALVRDYRRNLDLAYSDWAIDQILHWDNEWVPDNIVHIHGSNDHIFPIKYVEPDVTVKDGGHFMIMNKAAEINKIIKQNL